jgi:hypothetical protein
VVVGDAHVDDRVLARGRRVQLPTEPIEDLGDVLRGVRVRALEEQVLDEVRDPRLRGRLVARAGADPEAEGNRAHARDPLRDHPLARIELAQLVLLHEPSLETLTPEALGAALAAAFFSGRAAHATDATIEACFKPSNGTLYLLGGGSGRSECQPGDIPISWNTAGVNGQDGQDGDDFSGTFTSPNGQYKLVVDDTTARLEGPLAKVQIVGNGVQVEGPLARLRLLTTEASLNSSAQLTFQAQGLFSASGAVTALGGTPILLNGGACGLLRSTDVVTAVGPDGGVILLNPAGSLTVRTSC